MRIMSSIFFPAATSSAWKVRQAEFIFRNPDRDALGEKEEWQVSSEYAPGLPHVCRPILRQYGPPESLEKLLLKQTRM